MNVDWSFHFEEQFQRIIATIVQVLAIVRCSSMLVRNELLWDK